MDYRNFPLFSDLDDAQLKLLLQGCQQRTYAPGSLLIEAGSAGQEVFFVGAGNLRVFVKTPKGQQELAKIAPPAMVGEMEWFTGDKRQANVEAVDEVQALVLPFSALQTRLTDNSVAMLKVVYALGRVVATRLAALNRRVSDLQDSQTVTPEMAQLKKKLFADWAI